jgi:hypothetical protein
VIKSYIIEKETSGGFDFDGFCHDIENHMKETAEQVRMYDSYVKALENDDNDGEDS